ncbi:MAG TPA: NAD(P)H-binding protein, partial [Acidobacteriaceae bacterium]|nr:NAD(P)H-binding protein [Acidobacteriaceae bacterium]
MRIFLTGATGFVGSHVARSLNAAGADLRLLTRRTSRTEHLEGLQAELVSGDLLKPESLRSAISGCDALV